MSILLWKTPAGVTPPALEAAFILARPTIELQGPSNVWIDVTEDWRTDVPIVCTYGIQGSDPLDRVASSGSLVWQADNGGHPDRPLGWTSPISRTRRPFWRVNVPIRFSIGQAVGPRQTKFHGRLADALPDLGGLKGTRRTYCTALDLFDDWARRASPDMPAFQDHTSGQLVNQLLLNLPLEARPSGTWQLDAGQESFPWAFDGGAGQLLTVRERLNDVCLSEPAYAYFRGGPTDTQFVFEEASQRLANPPVLFALDDDAIAAIAAPSSRDDLYQTIRIWSYPTVVAPTPGVIYSTSGSTVPAGQTITIFGPYRDPNFYDLVGATAQVSPEPNTDYTMNAAADGSGADLTADVTVTASFTGVGVRLLITNTGGIDAVITRLDVRGQPIYRQEAIAERAVPNSYGVKTLDFDMPYQANMTRATALAELYANIYGQPYAKVTAVKFCASRSLALFEAARTLEPGDRITVTETLTGLEAAPFTINSVQLEVYGSGLLWCTWGLEQATAQQFWRLGQATLGVDTVLGF